MPPVTSSHSQLPKLTENPLKNLYGILRKSPMESGFIRKEKYLL
nr:MAG TPA: hypothetical protein [Caudoviricetes sp.]